MTRLKFCGLTRQQDVELALELGADYLGFIFVPQSPRALTPEDGQELLQNLPSEISSVAVTLNRNLDCQSFLERGFDYIQVIGGVIPEIDRKRQIPVYSVGQQIPEGLEDSSLKLFDTRVQGQLGGTGQSFDWNLVSQASPPFFIAGGLDCDNVDRALEFDPYGVDVSSGVESSPGVKDPQKMKIFAQKVKGKHS